MHATPSWKPSTSSIWVQAGSLRHDAPKQESRFQRGAYKSKEPQRLFLMDFQMAFSGLNVSSFQPCCSQSLFRRQASRKVLQEQLAHGGWKAGGCLLGPRLCVYTQDCDQTARAEVVCNIQSQRRAQSEDCILAEPKGQSTHALWGLD